MHLMALVYSWRSDWGIEAKSTRVVVELAQQSGDCRLVW